MLIADVIIANDYYRHYNASGAYAEHLKTSIRKYGVFVPILITRANILVDGLYRLKISEELGLKDIPHHYVDGDITVIQLVVNMVRLEPTHPQLVEQYKKLFKEYNLPQFCFNYALDEREVSKTLGLNMLRFSINVSLVNLHKLSELLKVSTMSEATNLIEEAEFMDENTFAKLVNEKIKKIREAKRLVRKD